MKHCAIVRDLLPMYIEELTSEESSAFVREHLSQCDECRAEYERMTAPTPPPVVVRQEWKDRLWEEMKKQERRKILKWSVLLAVVVLLLVGYALRQGFLLDSELIWHAPLQGQVEYLEASDDGFEERNCELRFAIYNPEENLIQLCFSIPMDESPSHLSTDLEYYLDGRKVDHSFSYCRDTWLKNYESIVIEKVGDFSELKLVWVGRTIIIRKNTD